MKNICKEKIFRVIKIVYIKGDNYNVICCVMVKKCILFV